MREFDSEWTSKTSTVVRWLLGHVPHVLFVAQKIGSPGSLGPGLGSASQLQPPASSAPAGPRPAKISSVRRRLSKVVLKE